MNKYEALQATMTEVKDHLRMSYVMEHYGHTPEIQDTDGKLHYISPFREDHNPSFDVFSYQIKGRSRPEERYGDHGDASLAQGDVVDLIAKFETLPGALALAKARELLSEQIDSGWAGHTVALTQAKALDMEEVARYVDKGRRLGVGSTWFKLTATHPGLSEVVLPTDRVFLHPDSDIIVFLLLDDDGEARGVRHRGPDGKKYGLPGGRNILMRLEASSDKPVFLCEGETDTWAAWGALHKDYEVLGVPGANTNPEKAGAASLAGRDVYIAFDPDDAGVAGRDVWSSYLLSVGCTVYIVVLPEGTDIAKLQPSQIAVLPSRARSLPPRPEGITQQDGTIGMLTAKGDDFVYKAVSNWSFTPLKILIAEDGSRAYQGRLSIGHEIVVLPDTSLSSSAKLKEWGRQYQARWFGNDPQVQQLAALIDHEAAYLPAGIVHDQVGLYEGSFVWPGHCIGEQEVVYQAPDAVGSVGPQQIFIKPALVNPIAVIEAALKAQHPAVITPILAWLAAAPLRTRFRRFPVLSISGVSGSGKSALTDEVLKAITGTRMAMTLSSTTPHAVSTQIDNSSGFPVWFDEYRPGARQETMGRLDQLMRDAYTMQASEKGGGNQNNLSAVKTWRTQAPIIVSGEDSFTETSHTDRMVLVRLRQNEQGNLGALQQINSEGFAHAYLHYLTRHRPDLPEYTPPVFERPYLVPTGIEGLGSRQEENARVLLYGWRELGFFLQEFDPTYELPPLDLSRVVDAGIEAAKSDPTMDLIQVCLENDTKNLAVWVWGEFVCVHPQNLIDEAKNHQTIVMPFSNSKGLVQFMSDKFGVEGTQMTNTPMDKYTNEVRRLRAVRIPKSVLHWANDDHQ